MARALRFPLLACALLAGMLGGCTRSPELGQVEGVFKLNGRPVPNIFVIFVPSDPKMPESGGITDVEGHFNLICDNKQMGAVLGDHKVLLIDMARSPTTPDGITLPEGEMTPTGRIPIDYTRVDRTTLKQKVVPGSQSVAIEINVSRD